MTRPLDISTTLGRAYEVPSPGDDVQQSPNGDVDPTRDHHRVSPEGRALGAQMARLVEPVIRHLEAHGEPDERCKSCAFRAGTVPNGCLQTMMDATKAAMEQTPFLCHVDHYANGSRRLCAGWLATQWGAMDREPVQCPWPFSPPDDEQEVAP